METPTLPPPGSLVQESFCAGFCVPGRTPDSSTSVNFRVGSTFVCEGSCFLVLPDTFVSTHTSLSTPATRAVGVGAGGAVRKQGKGQREARDIPQEKVLSGLGHPARPHFPQLPEPLKTVPPDSNQVFKTHDPEKTFPLQTTTLDLEKLLGGSCLSN